MLSYLRCWCSDGRRRSVLSSQRGVRSCSLTSCFLEPRRYQMAVRLGEIMEELEQQDHAAGDELNPVPSWIRAHFVLEQEFEQINARQQELEAAMSDADNQRMQARSGCDQRIGCQGPGSTQSSTSMQFAPSSACGR